MTTPHDHPNHHGAAAPGTLRCPECGEPARPVPPREWPLEGWSARPVASHLDGTALCPVPGPHGSQPADPIGAPARLALWQAVRQNWRAHPGWTTEDHLAWLDGEGYDITTATTSTTGDPAEVIGRWLAEHRRATPLCWPVTDPRVYVVAGDDMVAVFDDPDAAGAQLAVMDAAGHHTVAATLSVSQWDAVRPLVLGIKPTLVVARVRNRRARGGA